MPGRFVRRSVALALLLLLPAVGAAQPTYTWTGTASGVFSNTANWQGGVAPPAGGSTDTVLRFFVPQGFSSVSNDLAGDFALGVLEFNNRGSTALAFNRPAGGTARLAFSAAGAAITQSGNGEITFSTSTTATPVFLPLVLNTDVTVGGAGLGDITIGSQVTGTGRLVVAGGAPTVNTRVVSLSNTNANAAFLNSFGGVTIDGGNFEIGSTSTSILGGAGATLQVTANGGTLSLVSSSGTGGLLSGINVAAGGTLRVIGGSTLTTAPTAVISGGGNLALRGTGEVVVTSASTLTGSVTLDTPILGAVGTTAPTDLTLSEANGSLSNVSEVNVRGGATLTLGTTTGATNQNRLNDAAPVNLRGGLFAMVGGPSVSVNEAAGPLAGAGYSTVTVGTGGTITAGTGTARDSSLTFASLARTDRGTFVFRGTSLGLAPTGGSGAGTTARLLFTASPAGDLVGGGGAAGSTAISILPYAVGAATTTATGAATVTTGASLITYGPNGARPLVIPTATVAGEYATTLTSGADDNQNYRLDLDQTGTPIGSVGQITLSAATAVNSLVLSDGPAPVGTVAITGAGPLTLRSGVLLVNDLSATTIGVPLVFGGREAFIFTTSGDATLSGPLSGSNGLTKSGAGALILTADNGGLTGPLTVNAGELVFSAPNQLPGTGQVVVNGINAGAGNPGLLYNGAAALDLGRDIAVTTGYANFAVPAGAGGLTLSGTISGSGGVAITGTSATAPVALTGNNTYTGPTRVTSGTLVIDGDAALGSGGSLHIATAASGGLLLAGDWTTSRHIELATSRVNTGGFTAVWNGPVTGTTTLTKAGAGRLQINSSNPFDGTVLVENNGGEVRLTQDGQLNSTTFTLNNDGVLVLDNSILPSPGPIGMDPFVADRVSDAATVSVLNGGTLTVVGNGLRTVTERIGRLTGPTAAGVEGTLEVISSNGQLTVVRLGNLTVSNGSVLVRGTGLGLTSGSASQVFLDQFNSAAVTNNQLLAGVFAENLLNPGVVEGAIYDTTVGIRLSGGGDFETGPLIQNAAPTNTPTTANFRVETTTSTVDAANTINSLRFVAGSSLNAASGTLTVTTGNVLTQPGAGTATITGGTLTSGIASGTTNNVLAFAINSDLTVGSVLTGNAGLSKVGTGTLTLTAASQFTGAITVGAGTLAFGPGGSLVGGAAPNNLTLTAGATVDLNGVNQTIGFLSGTVPDGSPVSTVRLGSGVLTVASPTGSGTYAGLIEGGGRLVKQGTGTLTLGGTTPNTYSGGTRIEAGIVSVADVARLGTGAVSLAGGTLTYSGTTASAPLPGLIIEAAGGTLNASSTTTGAGLTLPATFTWNGPLTKAGSGRVFAGGPISTTQALTMTLGTLVTNNNPLTVGSLANSGTGTVDVGTSGTFTPNTLTFPTNVAGTGGTLALAAGSTFNPTGTAQTVSATITGATAVNYTPAASGVLTLGGANTFAGGVTGNAFARYNLTSPTGFGTGPVVFTNETADTTVDLAFTFGAGSFTVPNNIQLTGFGGLATIFNVVSASSSVQLTGLITGGAASTPDNLTQTRLQINGNDVLATATAIKFTNPNNTFQAIIELTGGSLAVENNATLGLAENIVRLNNGTATARTGLRFDADFTGANAFPRTIAMQGASSVNTQGFNVVLGGPVVDAITPPTIVGGDPVVNTGDDLAKVGTGTLTLANAANTFSGLLSVNEGSVVVTGNIAPGFAAADIVAVNASGRLAGTGTISRPVSLNAGGTLQGGVDAASGSLALASTLTLDGANTLRTVVGGPPATPTNGLVAVTGAVGLNAGGAATDLTTILLVNDGTLDLSPTATYTVTVATFASTTATSANFTVAGENFGVGTFTVLVNPTSLQVQFVPVPEPATVLAVGAVGLSVVSAVRRRAKRGGSV